MSQPPTRRIMKILFTNLINSFRPRQISGNLMGQDYFGNKFYEIPADPQNGRRKAARWFEPVDKENFEQEVTAEWEAWLRGRRKVAPTDEELMQNLAIIKMKEKNSAELDKKYNSEKDPELLEKQIKGKGLFMSTRLKSISEI
jgi:NADH:ubiquinone oxidoreductase subunit